MSKKVVSVLNATPHVNAYCFCGEHVGSSIDAKSARAELFKHMRKHNHLEGSIEVGRVSHYKLITNKEALTTLTK